MSEALIGQATAMVVAPRCSSMRMGSAAVSTGVGDGIGSAMNPAGSTGRIVVNASGCAAANTQRRWRLALMPLAIATEAIEPQAVCTPRRPGP